MLIIIYKAFCWSYKQGLYVSTFIDGLEGNILRQISPV